MLTLAHMMLDMIDDEQLVLLRLAVIWGTCLRDGPLLTASHEGRHVLLFKNVTEPGLTTQLKLGAQECVGPR